MIDLDGSEVSLQEYQRRVLAGEFCVNCKRWGTVNWYGDSLGRRCFLHTDYMTGPYFSCGQFERLPNNGVQPTAPDAEINAATDEIIRRGEDELLRRGV